MHSPSARLLRLLSLLQSRREWPGAALADRLQVTDRTIRRDVDRLRAMGYRVVATKGPDGGYRLDAGSELPPLLLDDDQVLALTVALQSTAGADEAAARALTTLRQVLPDRLRRRLDALRFTATVDVPARDVPDRAVLIALSAAIRDRVQLRFDYAGGSGGATRGPGPARRAEPHHLVLARGRWYLIGWDLERADWRIYRADRITPRSPGGPRFVRREVPGSDPHAFLSARFKGSPDVDAWPCHGTVVIDLPADAVLPFAGDATVEDLGERCTVHSGSWSWTALASSFGRFDAPIRVVGPAELADAFDRVAHRFAAASRSAG